MRGFSANLGLLYTSLPMAERMDAAARDGFRCVEFQFPYELDPRFIHDRLDELELQLLGINTDVDPGPAGHFGLAALPDRVEEARMLIDRAIELIAGRVVHSAATDVEIKTRASVVAGRLGRRPGKLPVDIDLKPCSGSHRSDVMPLILRKRVIDIEPPSSTCPETQSF